MGNCKYNIYKDGQLINDNLSRDELINLVMDEVGSDKDIIDILYSKESKAEKTFNEILNLKSQSIEDSMIRASKVAGNTDVEAEGYISTQNFIDHDEFLFHGQRVIPQKRDDEFKKNTMLELQRDNLAKPEANRMTDEELNRKVDQIVNNWEVINEDAMEIHGRLNGFDFYKGNMASFASSMADSKFSNASSSIYQQMTEKGGVLSIMRGAHKIDNEKTKMVRGLNLKAKLNYIDKDILGHIDNLIIDTDGNVHIYNYKFSQSITADWKSAKWEKYKYQLALIKQILAYNGIDTSDTTLHIIPIKANYNEDLSEINDVVIAPPIEISTGSSFEKYDTMAKYHIKSNVKIEPINTETIEKINKNLGMIFPDRTVSYQGIQNSVDEWIRHNYSSKWQNRIKKVEGKDYAYELYLNEDFNEPILIKDDTHPSKNEEIKKHVEEYIKNNKGDSNRLHKIVNKIRSSKSSGVLKFQSNNTNLNAQKVESFLEKSLAKYILNYEEVDGTKVYEWDLISNDELHDANILLFKNGNQIDCVVLSGYDLMSSIKFNNRSNIMGSYISDTSRDASNLINYKATFANIEAVKAMTILNEVLPKINQSKLTLGDMKIISTAGDGQMEVKPIETINKELFQDVIKVVSKNNPEFSMSNNFKDSKYVDPMDLLIQDYIEITSTSSFSKATADEFASLGIENLESLSTKEQKKVELLSVINRIFEIDPVLQSYSAKKIVESAKSDPNRKRQKLSNLYIEAQQAYCYYAGIKVNSEIKISSIEEYALKTSRVPNSTFQKIFSMYTEAVDKIAYRVRDKYNHIYSYTIDFYNKQGYGKIATSVVGNLNRAFDNLYRVDEAGNRMMEFRNPYENDTQTPLKDHERTYLKKVLYEFAKVKSKMYGFDFPFTINDIDTKEYKGFIEKSKRWYFLVPLEKASKASIRSRGIESQFEETKRKLKKWYKSIKGDPKAYINEVINDIATDDEAGMYETSFDSLSLTNNFILGDGFTDESSRRERLEKYGNDFWETNVENILAHYLEKQVQVEEFSKTLIAVKGSLLSLELLGDAIGDKNQEGLEQTERMIKDFVKLNMFNQSIMEPTSQKLAVWLKPFRDLVSKAYIAGNIVSMFRDTFEGVWQNVSRSLIKYGTDIDGKSLKKAYGLVTSASFTSIRNLTVIDALCKTYRLSNLDVARISDGLTTSTGGILNAENWMYQTLRAPDFLNRMTLFIARLVKDGSYDAFKMVDNKLIYDWKKDKRYAIYASGDKNNPEYENQRIAYYNAIRVYNQENPDATISFKDDLPVAYSNAEIKGLRELANSIYGAYDKSMKAKMEYTMLGYTFGMFTTWMNGLVSNYWAKPGTYEGSGFFKEQDTDGSGNLLFMDANGIPCYQITDENGNSKYYYEETGEELIDLQGLAPIYRNTPRIIQGIIQTLGASFNAMSKGGLTEFRKEILNNPSEAANLRKLLNDIIAALLFSLIFKLAIDPAYKDTKKHMEEHTLLENALAEVLYKSTSRSYDGFMGPLNVIKYLGDSTNPPAYGLSIEIIKNLIKVATGKKQVPSLLIDHTGIFRGFKDTYKAELKKDN